MRSASRPLVLAVLLAAACGTPPTGIGPDPSDPGSADAGGPVHEDGAPLYECMGVTVAVDELSDATLVADLDHPGADALADHVLDPERARVVGVADDRLRAVEPMDPPEELDGALRDHHRTEVELVVEPEDAPGEPEADADGWSVTSAGPCELRLVMTDGETAVLELDPGRSPDREARTLALQVTERGCASGQPATDRVTVTVTETDDVVELVAAVTPPDGAQTCPSNPPTPVQVELDGPLGDRELVDAGRHPPVAIADDVAGG